MSGFVPIGGDTTTWRVSQQDQVRQAYRNCLPPEGQSAAMVWDDLTAFCHGGTSSFVPGDPYLTAFNEGKRAVLLHMAAMAAPTISKET